MTARVHHAARRCGGYVAGRGASAANREFNMKLPRRQFLKLAALLGDLVQTYRSGAAGVASGPGSLPDQ